MGSTHFTETADSESSIAPSKRAGEFRFASVLWDHWRKVVVALPLVTLIWVVARYAVDVPYLDQWELVPLLDKMYRGELGFHDLWMQFNEHRIFFPKLIMLGMARLTQWNIRYEAAVNVVLVIGVWLVLAWQIRATATVFGQRRLRWALPACSLVAFSISQYENFLWGWQIQVLLGLLAALGSILLLANQPFSWKKFTAALLLGIVATFSFANGALVWPIGLALLCVTAIDAGCKRAALSGWTIGGIICFWLYVRDYHKPAGHPPLTFIFNQPIVFVSYVLKYIGSTCAQYGEGGIFPDRISALVFGVAGFAVLGWAGWKTAVRMRDNRAALAPYVAMCAYSLGTALITATARAGFGRGQALCSRYCSMTGPLWLSMIVMLMLLSGRDGSGESIQAAARPSTKPDLPRDARIARWLLSGVVIFLAFSSGFAIRSAKEFSERLTKSRQDVIALRTNSSAKDPHEELLTLSGDPQLVIQEYPVLLTNRLSLFRE